MGIQDLRHFYQTVNALGLLNHELPYLLIDNLYVPL